MQEDIRRVIQRQGGNKRKAPRIEEEKENPKNTDIIKGCFIADMSKFDALEQSRFEKFVEERNIRDFEQEFPYYRCNKTVRGVPLKHYVQHKCTYNDRNLMGEIMDNKEFEDVVYTPSTAQDLPEYFANYE